MPRELMTRDLSKCTIKLAFKPLFISHPRSSSLQPICCLLLKPFLRLLGIAERSAAIFNFFFAVQSRFKLKRKCCRNIDEPVKPEKSGGLQLGFLNPRLTHFLTGLWSGTFPGVFSLSGRTLSSSKKAKRCKISLWFLEFHISATRYELPPRVHRVCVSKSVFTASKAGREGPISKSFELFVVISQRN